MILYKSKSHTDHISLPPIYQITPHELSAESFLQQGSKLIVWMDAA